MRKASRRDKQTDFKFRKVKSASGLSKVMVIELQTISNLYKARC